MKGAPVRDDIDQPATIREIFGAGQDSDVVVPPPRGARGVMLLAYANNAAAAYFSNEEGPWITHNPHPLDCPPFLPVDGHVPLYFPPYAILPLTAVRNAVAEYLRTGTKPGCVEWTMVNWYTVAG